MHFHLKLCQFEIKIWFKDENSFSNLKSQFELFLKSIS